MVTDKIPSPSDAGKAAGGIGGTLGIADVAEGSGLDRAAAAAGEVTRGLSQAASQAGDVLRGIFNGLPWNMGGGDVSEAASSIVVYGTDLLTAGVL